MRTKTLLIIITLLLLTPIVCGAMLWVSLSEMQTQTKALTIDFWCSPENQILLCDAIKAEGYDLKSYPPSDTLAVTGREYLRLEEKVKGESWILMVLLPDCDANGEFKMKIVWQTTQRTV